MVKEELEPEVVSIFQEIKQGNNFLLSGGAGSGKTYSLVQVIKKGIEDNPTIKIACITYTNAAVKEIEKRVDHVNLEVSTIHDFLWDNVKFFQKELKKGLVALLHDSDSGIIKPSDLIISENFFDNIENGIQYKEYTKIKDGIISHDEVLVLANYMFKSYPLLCDILKDKFKFIFIDEYQDTNPVVIEIFLEHLKQSKKKNIIGFFGDAMQSIYDDGVGDLKNYIQKGEVVEIPKLQNRRNPQSVINLANLIRTDGLAQEPSIDSEAPNMVNGKIKEGKITFLYSDSDDLEKIRTLKYFEGWDFADSNRTKELNLTHNLIASKAGFPILMEIYDKDPIIDLKNQILKKQKELSKKNTPIIIDETDSFDTVVDKFQIERGRGKEKQLVKEIILSDFKLNSLYSELKDLPFNLVQKIYLDKDSLIDDKKQNVDDENRKGSKRDGVIKHLFKIQNNIYLYEFLQYNEFIRRTEYPIKSVSDKRILKDIIGTISKMSNATIEEVINFADEKNICRKDDKFFDFVENNRYLYNRVKKVRFEEFQNLFFYLEGYTPFSTQHKTKGAEFENIFVILDNGKWNKYNFDYLFTNRTDKPEVLLRTQKIFYVCCTRTKEHLVVFYHKPSLEVIEQANLWFGSENVHLV